MPYDQTTSSPEDVKSHSEPAMERNTEKRKQLDNMFYCKESVYQCKKEVSLRKHINTKHFKKVQSLQFRIQYIYGSIKTFGR